MKKLAVAMVLLSLPLSGCISRMTGPGSAGTDVSKMKETELACFIHVLGFGPFDNAVLKTKVDAIEYSFENFVVFGRVCAHGYKK
jgi:predicted small secreted protein